MENIDTDKDNSRIDDGNEPNSFTHLAMVFFYVFFLIYCFPMSVLMFVVLIIANTYLYRKYEAYRVSLQAIVDKYFAERDAQGCITLIRGMITTYTEKLLWYYSIFQFCRNPLNKIFISSFIYFLIYYFNFRHV